MSDPQTARRSWPLWVAVTVLLAAALCVPIFRQQRPPEPAPLPRWPDSTELILCVPRDLEPTESKDMTALAVAGCPEAQDLLSRGYVVLLRRASRNEPWYVYASRRLQPSH